MQALTHLVVFSGISFLCYGVLCIFSKKMVAEFNRYQLSKFRTLVGCLEILGGLGLLVGLYDPLIMIISSAGLSLLMFLGCATRLKIKDSFIQTLPAFSFMLVNFYIFLKYAEK